MSTEARRKVFLNIAAKKLVPNNSFRNFAVKDAPLTGPVMTIVIPQATQSIEGGMGRANYNASGNDTAEALAIKVFKGSKKEYSAEVFYTNPYVIELQDEKELSYDKKSVVVEGHTDYLHTRFAEYTVSNWTPSYDGTAAGLNLIESTGSEVRTSTVIGGYTGLVKKITKDDIIKVRAQFMKMNLGKPLGGKLYGLITVDQWNDLMEIDEFARYDSLGVTSSLIDGEIKNVMGINFIVRENEVSANVALRSDVSGTTYTKIAFDAALSTGDTSAAMFWHSDFVRETEGSLDAYYTPKDGVSRGDILNFEARIGATIMRTDEKGVVCLVEKKTA